MVMEFTMIILPSRSLGRRSEYRYRTAGYIFDFANLKNWFSWSFGI